MIDDRKIGAWANPIVNEADRPNRSAADMKSIFDSNSNELKDAVNGVVDDIKAGDFQVAFTQAVSLANITADDSMSVILGKLAKFFSEAQTALSVVQIDADHPNRYLSANGTYSVPTAGSAVNGLPEGGATGEVLFKSSTADYDSEWNELTPTMIGAVSASTVGSPNGICQLDSDGKVDKTSAASSIVFHNASYTVSASDFGKLHSSNNVTCTATIADGIAQGEEVEFLAKGSAVLTIALANANEHFLTSAGTVSTISSSGTNASIVIKKVGQDVFLAKGDIA